MGWESGSYSPTEARSLYFKFYVPRGSDLLYFLLFHGGSVRYGLGVQFLLSFRSVVFFTCSCSMVAVVATRESVSGIPTFVPCDPGVTKDSIYVVSLYSQVLYLYTSL